MVPIQGEMPLRHHSMIVPPSGAGVRQAASAFAAFAKSHGLPTSAIWKVQVALDEVLSNVVRHGSAAGGVGPIGVELDLEGPSMEIVVSDDAPAFNPLEAPPPDTSVGLEERPLGGLGIALIRALVDEVRYERRDGRNRLSLRKTIAG